MAVIHCPSLQCPVTCGRGYQMRAVHCVSGIHGRMVSDRECNAATRPINSQVNVPFFERRLISLSFQ